MNKSILIIFIFSMMSCAQDSSTKTATAVDNVTPIVTKTCSGFYQRSWLNSLGAEYNMNSNCTGTIPSCGAEFNYEATSNNSGGGTFKVTLTKSNGNPGCPVPGYTECIYRVYILNSGQITKMELTCDGEAMQTFTPKAN